MIDSMEMNDKQKEELVKHTALKFLGNEPDVQQQFSTDTAKPPPVYPAPPILWEVLGVLRQNSQIFYKVFEILITSLLPYYLGRIAAKKDQEELISKIKEILKENQELITVQLKTNKRIQSKLRWNIAWRIQGLKYPQWKSKWEIRLKVYAEKAQVLLSVDKAAKILVQIFVEGVRNSSRKGD